MILDLIVILLVIILSFLFCMNEKSNTSNKSNNQYCKLSHIVIGLTVIVFYKLVRYYKINKEVKNINNKKIERFTVDQSINDFISNTTDVIVNQDEKTLSDAISSRWRYYIDNRMELLSFGTATIAFYVTQEGKIEDIHLLSNSSNQTFADCCIKSIMEAKLPAIPPEVAATLQDKKLEVEYRFTICSDTDF